MSLSAQVMAFLIVTMKMNMMGECFMVVKNDQYVINMEFRAITKSSLLLCSATLYRSVGGGGDECARACSRTCARVREGQGQRARPVLLEGTEEDEQRRREDEGKEDGNAGLARGV